MDTLIFGGMDRGIDYSGFVSFLERSAVSNLIGLPDTGCRLCAEMREHGCLKNIIIVEDMEQAVDEAFRCTKQGMTCLMSPAASSYNVYKDFEHKGKHFKDLVKNHE